MTPEKIQKIIAILTGAKTLLQTLLKPGLVKTIIINLLDAAIEVINDEDDLHDQKLKQMTAEKIQKIISIIEVINDEDDIEQKGRKLLPKNQGT